MRDAIDQTDIERRFIRVFISSTFKDLDKERDYLVRKTFPILQQLYAKKNITLLDIDLRWGITEEEAQKGLIKDICIEQIELTKPFFIGLVGDRYGWVTGDSPDSVSITETEMEYAVFGNDSPVYGVFLIRKCDGGSSFHEPQASVQKLEKLKNRIRRQGKCPVFEFSSLEELNDHVIGTVTAWIDKLYPESGDSEAEMVSVGQKYFMASRRPAYRKIENSFRHLDVFLQGTCPVCALMGETGSGRRSFLIHAADVIREKNLGPVVEYYFTEGMSSAACRNALYYIADRIARSVRINDAAERESRVDFSYDRNFNELINAINRSDRTQPWFLIIGGMELLSDKDFEQWLRVISDLPKNIRVLFSAGNHYSQKQMARTVLNNVDVYEHLVISSYFWTEEDRAQVIRDFFTRYGKTFEEGMVAEILNSPRDVMGYNVFNKPLNMRILLNELRLFGKHEKLHSFVTRLCEKSEESTHFFTTLMDIWSEEFDYKGNNMVRDVFGLLNNMETGISERDILEFTGAPAINWQHFFATLDMFVEYRNGRLFYTSRAHKTVFSMALSASKTDITERWIKYLENKYRSADTIDEYTLVELLYQYKNWLWNFSDKSLALTDVVSEDMKGHFISRDSLHKLEERLTKEAVLDRYHRTIRDYKVLELLYSNGHHVFLRKCWGVLSQYGYSPEIYYQDIMEACDKDKQASNLTLFGLGNIYNMMEETELSYKVYLTIIDNYSEDEMLSFPFYNAATYMFSAGKLNEAKELIDRALALARKEYADGVVTANEYGAMLFLKTNADLRTTGDKDTARREYNQILALLDKQDSTHFGLQIDIYNELATLCKEERSDLAEDFYSKVIELNEAQPYDGSTARRIAYAMALFNLANLYFELQTADEKAFELYLTAFNVFASLSEVSDHEIYCKGVAGHRTTALGYALNREDINYVNVLKQAASSFQLLYHYRKGWEWCEEEYVQVLEIMGLVAEDKDSADLYAALKIHLDDLSLRA